MTGTWVGLAGLTARNPSLPQAFDESIDKALVIAEEQLLPRGAGGVARLALQELGGHRLRLRLLAQNSQRGRKRRERGIADIGLSRCPPGKFGCDVIFAERKMRPGARVVETPEMIVARAQH